MTLTFTEPLNERLSRASMVSVTGGREADVAVAASAKGLVLRPKRELAAGAYRVSWHTVSTEDGHALEGTFSFGVRAPAAGAEHVVEQSPFARSGWLRVLLRGLFYVAALMFVGGLLLRVLLSPTGSWLVPSGETGLDGDAVERRERALLVDTGWAAAGLAVAVTVAEAADAAGGLSPAGLRDFLLSSGAGAGRVAAVTLLAAATLTATRSPRAAAALATAAFGAIAASGHAASATPRVPSVVNDWVHLLSGAVWLGGIAFILAVLAPMLRRLPAATRTTVARSVLPAFGRVALPAFAVVSATGLVSLLTQLGSVNALWETGYGRVLAVKVVLVGAIAGASYLHAIRLRPRLLDDGPSERQLAVERRHWRLLRSEPALGLGVIAAVAVLVAFPLPPRQLDEAEQALAAGAPCDPCPLPAPADDELPVADNAGRVVVAAWLRRDAGAVSGTVLLTHLRAKPSRAPATVAGARQRSCGVGCIEFSGMRGDVLEVAVRDGGRTFSTELPTRWTRQGTTRANRLLNRAQTAMRALHSVRESELVSSGPGSYARTEYRLKAPDRMAFTTDAGTSSVLIGDRQWLRTADDRSWRTGQAAQGLRFRTRRWFRWTPYARHVRLLGERRTGAGRRLAELALFDPGTPVWMTLTVDVSSHRVLRERSITKAHFATQRYHSFNEPVRIQAPEAADVD